MLLHPSCSGMLVMKFAVRQTGLTKPGRHKKKLPMNNSLRLHRLILAMTAYDHGDPMRIQHFMKVLGYASTIGRLEGLDPETQAILESAAVLHDIAIHISEQKYGSSNGKYQEQEGPAEARRLLASLTEAAAPAASLTEEAPAPAANAGRLSTPAPLYTPAEVDRICFLIAHHHTYNAIDAPDYQILVEADFLVNLYEDHSSPASAGTVDPKAAEAAQHVYDKIFRTATGRALLRSMFLTPRT